MQYCHFRLCCAKVHSAVYGSASSSVHSRVKLYGSLSPHCAMVCLCAAVHTGIRRSVWQCTCEYMAVYAIVYGFLGSICGNFVRYSVGFPMCVTV